MTQGSSFFSDFTISVQSKNSLLSGTTSHLEEDKLHHQLEVKMEEGLSKRCVTKKVNKIEEFKLWLNEVNILMTCSEPKGRNLKPSPRIPVRQVTVRMLLQSCQDDLTQHLLPTP
jgi:hypothetical protein